MRLKKIRRAVICGEFDTTDADYRREGAKIDQLGLKFLGSGMFADVFALTTRHVLKITRVTDDGYDTFVNIALRHQHNPFFPKIYYRGRWGEHSVYILERLSKRGDTDGYAKKRRLIAIAEGRRQMSRLKNPDERELMTALTEQFTVDDLHTGNIMWRGKQLVITDPATG